MASTKTAISSAPETARLKTYYRDKLVKELKNELNLSNPNQVPKLEKIVLNVGLGKSKDDKRIFDVATNTLSKITGQRPVETVAKNSIAGFKLREGSKIGLKVTLRDERMYEFYDRLVNIVMPRLRDFHGASSTSFDKMGNYSLGLVDQSVFPELSFEETAVPHGIQIVFVIRCEQLKHSRILLEKLGMPFTKGKL